LLPSPKLNYLLLRKQLTKGMLSLRGPGPLENPACRQAGAPARAVAH